MINHNSMVKLSDPNPTLYIYIYIYIYTLEKKY